MTSLAADTLRLKQPVRRLTRALFSLFALGCLAACASHTVQRVDDVQEIQEAKQYQARARAGYQPPGTDADPWGPYIAEAARIYDVPQTWIREVMHQESGGNLYRNGGLVTSWVGAMGLMQVMPSTYDELKARYRLGDDAYDPHDNIMAGAAYMREMYDMYGAPGFLAAYNAGPRRLDDYLANLRPLPEETRNYVARIGPNIEGVFPVHRSPAENYAMNDLPNVIPPGPTLRRRRRWRSGCPRASPASLFRPRPPGRADRGRGAFDPLAPPPRDGAGGADVRQRRRPSAARRLASDRLGAGGDAAAAPRRGADRRLRGRARRPPGRLACAGRCRVASLGPRSPGRLQDPRVPRLMPA